jgi:rRNA maturation endonuclease Nob1
MRLIRFFKAIIKYIRFGQQTTIDDYINRLTICKSCDKFDNEKWVCKKCGCYLDKKAKMNTENCPDNKW